MFVHGEQADTILGSLLALMASFQSLSRSQTVTCPACFIITIIKPHKIHLFLYSDIAHPKPDRGKIKSLAQTLKSLNRNDTDDTCNAKMPAVEQQDVAE